MSQPAISKHLKVLERAGLISTTQDAQRRPRGLVAQTSRSPKPVNGWTAAAKFGKPIFSASTLCWKRRRREENTHARRGEIINERHFGAEHTLDLEIAMTRVFNAPRRLVFEAFTKPEPA
jgi:DNA-binding transcriptional ArsR family regulator